MWLLRKEQKDLQLVDWDGQPPLHIFLIRMKAIDLRWDFSQMALELGEIVGKPLLGPTNLKEWCLHRWGAASTSTCGVPFAAFISVGSSKVAIRIGLSAYPEFSLLLLLESVGPFSITSLWCRSFLCCSPYHPPLPILLIPGDFLVLAC